MARTISAGLALGVGLILCGCAIERAQLAQKAQVQMIGLPKEKVLACMGVPANKMSVGDTEVWAYSSGNGETQGTLLASGGNGVVTGLGVTTQRFCNINIVMTGGVVSAVNYTGPTGGLLSQGEQCAYAVQNCAQ